MDEDVVIVVDDGRVYLVFAKNPTTIKVVDLDTGNIGADMDYDSVSNSDDYHVVFE